MFVLLVLAALTAGGVYAWKNGLLPGLGPAHPPPPPADATSSAAPLPQPGGSASRSAVALPGGTAASAAAPTGPSSIFDDGGGGTASTGNPSPPVSSGELRARAITPPAPGIAALEAAAREAERSLAQTREAAIAKLRPLPQFAARQQEVDRLETALRQARASGTPQQKIDASAAWNKARLALDRDYDAALAADPAYVSAKTAAQRATDALRSARAGAARPAAAGSGAR